ncbi:rhomboid family intramembrane serine protease [bacterium]|nr:rhomboid family intramembrane serine protease [bacterium]
MIYRNDYRPRPAFQFTFAVKFIIGICIFFFLLQMFMPNQLLNYLALVPALVLRKFFIWQLVTYMFLHGSFMHLFFNMFALFMFGTAMENTWGTKKFLQYYFVTGIGAGIIWTIFNSVPTIGASGAIYGLLLAYGITYPNRYIYVYFMIPVKAKYFVIIFGVLEFLASFGVQDGVAHLAHLSGMLIGLFYLKGIPFIKRKIRYHGFKVRKSTTRYKSKPVEEEELDRILDKILLLGEDSLTPRERQILSQASRDNEDISRED